MPRRATHAEYRHHQRQVQGGWARPEGDRQLIYFDAANTPGRCRSPPAMPLPHASWLGMMEPYVRSGTTGDEPFAYRMTDAGIARRKVLIAAQADDNPAVTVPLPPGHEIQFSERTTPPSLTRAPSDRAEARRGARHAPRTDGAASRLVEGDQRMNNLSPPAR